MIKIQIEFCDDLPKSFDKKTCISILAANKDYLPISLLAMLHSDKKIYVTADINIICNYTLDIYDYDHEKRHYSATKDSYKSSAAFIWYHFGSMIIKKIREDISIDDCRVIYKKFYRRFIIPAEQGYLKIDASNDILKHINELHEYILYV